jgi:hypothetical protein
MLFRKKLRKHQWRKEWQDRLSVLLESATARLKLNMVFVVAEESDPYSELLFLFSFIGVSVGSFVGLFLKVFKWDIGIDLYVFPLLGFTGFGLFHTRKSLWLRKFFKNLAETRVQQKARAYFYDYHSNPTIPMILVYISESERKLEILRSPDMIQQLSPSRIGEIQKMFDSKYADQDPLAAVEAIIEQISAILGPLRKEISVNPEDISENFSRPIFVTASDLDLKVIPILKGSKDVN